MFKPTHDSIRSFTLSNEGVIHALNKQGKIVVAWHPHEAIPVTEKGPSKSTIVAQLNLELVTEIADAVARQLLAEFTRTTDKEGGDHRERGLSVARTAHGGRKALRWANEPLPGELPVTDSNVRILREVCEDNTRGPARRLTSIDQDLLAALFFGEFVFSTHLIW